MTSAYSCPCGGIVFRALKSGGVVCDCCGVNAYRFFGKYAPILAKVSQRLAA